MEDAEFSKTAAFKAKQNLELELGDVQQQLEDIMRSKSDLEDRLMRVSREKTDMSSQIEDNEEELHEVMKKYKASVSQLSVDQITIQEQSNRVTDLEEEKNQLKSQVSELTVKITSLEGENLANPAQSRLELKVWYSICICSLVFLRLFISKTISTCFLNELDANGYPFFSSK